MDYCGWLGLAKLSRVSRVDTQDVFVCDRMNLTKVVLPRGMLRIDGIGRGLIEACCNFVSACRLVFYLCSTNSSVSKLAKLHVFVPKS